MSSNSTFISLYDFFGRAAGKKVGDAVYKLSLKESFKPQTRMVENSAYVGKVMLYPTWWLNKVYKK